MVALIAATAMMAQKGPRKEMSQRPGMDFTPEQMATLQSKRMALMLDLTEKQQQQVYGLKLKSAQARKARMGERKALKGNGQQERPSAQQRYDWRVAQLDRQLAHQEQMQKILNDEQYQQWRTLRRQGFGKWKNQTGKRHDFRKKSRKEYRKQG